MNREQRYCEGYIIDHLSIEKRNYKTTHMWVKATLLVYKKSFIYVISWKKMESDVPNLANLVLNETKIM